MSITIRRTTCRVRQAAVSEPVNPLNRTSHRKLRQKTPTVPSELWDLICACCKKRGIAPEMARDMRRSPSESYREDRRHDSVHQQRRHVVRRHLLSERRQGAAVVGLLVVHVEPPEDSHSPWTARNCFKSTRRRRRTPAVLMCLPSLHGYRRIRWSPAPSKSTPALWRCSEWPPSWSGTELREGEDG